MVISRWKKKIEIFYGSACSLVLGCKLVAQCSVINDSSATAS